MPLSQSILDKSCKDSIPPVALKKKLGISDVLKRKTPAEKALDDSEEMLSATDARLKHLYSEKVIKQSN